VKNESGNPALSDKLLERLATKEGASTATISGTSIKILVLLAISIIGGYFGWQSMMSSSGSGTMIIGASVAALGFGIATAFRPNMAGITGPLYALAQGYVLGAISQMYNASLEGIVIQAIGLTGAIFFVSLWAFWLGLIKVTDKFRTGVIIATVGIALYYVVAFVMGLFGAQAPLLYDTGLFGIIFCLVIVFVATLNLMLDFDLIQRFEKQGAPKNMEWYGAFALIVTLLWLYVEVLRLLSKVRQ
jgi:uncharacterized YccA/Bax inhibitor family protein